MTQNALQGTAPEDYNALLQAVVLDQGVSHALKNRVQEDLKRDPLDALKDAEMLQHIMQLRFERLVQNTLVSAPRV